MCIISLAPFYISYSKFIKTQPKSSNQDRRTSLIKEAVHVRKEGSQVVNRDEGYQLSQAYDRFLGTSSLCHVKNRKN